LKKDHRKVSAIFKKIIAASSSKVREKLFLEVKKELTLHADPEHATFYKALQKSQEGKEDAQHGDKEHSEIKDALAKLSKISSSTTNKWLVQFGELKYIVEHHVEDEESKMFEDGKEILSSHEAEELTVQMEALKVEMKGSMKFKKEFGSLDQKHKNKVSKHKTKKRK
jgi:hypothetical protein